MGKECCSYCQRPYGTSYKNMILAKTMDHIIPRKKLGIAQNRVTKVTLKQCLNLIDCCQFCNSTKSDLSLEDFVKRVQKDKKISEKIKLRIKNSVYILLNTESVPIPLNYLV